MNTKLFSEAITEINDKYYAEAINYKKKTKKLILTKSGVVAACLAVILTVGHLLAPFQGDMVISTYAYGTDEKITAAGVVMSSGTISDNGEMRGHPLMFYLSGKNIVSVRFSCKNQQINFTDWTEKRDEYGDAQNFTVAYGENESEYYYLTIDWVPNSLIRELTDNADVTIATLPEEMRHDIIVMEITFDNGKNATKAITISLLDDGTFFAAFDDYRISEADTFVNRPDSEAVPRDILYSQDDELSGNESETIQKPDSLSAVEKIVRAYYASTIFEIISLEVESQTENEIIFSVCVSKGGVIQEPNRTISLQLHNGEWEVINEGY